MAAEPEAQARAEIERLLGLGWHVCDMSKADIDGHRGVAIREFNLTPGHGSADHLLYVDGTAAALIEAKKRKAPTLIGAERQSDSDRKGLLNA